MDEVGGVAEPAVQVRRTVRRAVLRIVGYTPAGRLFQAAAFDEQQGQRKSTQTLDLGPLGERAAVQDDELGPGSQEIFGLLQKALNDGVVVGVRVLSAARQQRRASGILIEDSRAGQPPQGLGQGCLARTGQACQSDQHDSSFACGATFGVRRASIKWL